MRAAEPYPRETIRTPRLALVPMSSRLVLAILEKDWMSVQRLLGAPFPREWRNDGWQWLQPQAANGNNDDRFIIWGTRLALPPTFDVGPDRGPVLAEIGFHGPPDRQGWVEIGYRVVVEHRRQGLAEEATSALLAWGAAHGATGIKASVSPSNTASISLLHKLDFTATGSYQHHVLGEQLSFRRAAPQNNLLENWIPPLAGRPRSGQSPGQRTITALDTAYRPPQRPPR